MDALEAARRYVEGWSRAWPAGDAEAVAALYAEDAVYLSHPFREAHRGTAGVLAYARTSFEEEELVDVRFGEPVASGNRASVEYWALLRAGRDELTLAGNVMLRFAPDGRVEEQRDYWAIQDGRRPSPRGWGR